MVVCCSNILHFSDTIQDLGSDGVASLFRKLERRLGKLWTGQVTPGDEACDMHAWLSESGLNDHAYNAVIHRRQRYPISDYCPFQEIGDHGTSDIIFVAVHLLPGLHKDLRKPVVDSNWTAQPLAALDPPRMRVINQSSSTRLRAYSALHRSKVVHAEEDQDSVPFRVISYIVPSHAASGIKTDDACAAS